VQGVDKVVEQLPDNVEFHLYGTGAMEEKLKSRKYPKIFFHGPYFRSQQNKILSACDIAVVTLQKGMYGLGVPSKTYNILAAGRPIIFFGPEGSEIDLLVRENGIGYCGWPKVWNRRELIDMGAKARKLAVRDYSKKVILSKFLDLI
jgi:glycosyltransferase involved in cell wall biosynthesis